MQVSYTSVWLTAFPRQSVVRVSKLAGVLSLADGLEAFRVVSPSGCYRLSQHATDDFL